MSSTRLVHPDVRYGPLATPADALDLVARLSSRPSSPEVVCVLLDGARRVGASFTVTDVVDPDGVLHVAEMALAVAAATAEIDGIVLASIRPSPLVERAGSDLDRWCRLDDLCNDLRCELVEWLVLTPDRVALPRERLGAPSRWWLGVPPG